MYRGTISALVLDARFEVVRELGRGAHATVYLVWDNADDGFRAIKILSDAHRERTAILRRFVREARLLTRLEHPHVLRLYRTGLLDSRPYLVTEYADGGSAADWLRRHGPVPAPLAAEMCAQAASALDAAHRAGIVHRDVKPSNLLLSDRGTLVGDFGVACATDEALGRLTPLGESMGTLGFLAPEQLDGSADVSHAADLYGLGATLCNLVTGRPPRDLHLRRPHEAPICELPPELRPIVLRACDRRPERRYPTAGAMAEALLEARRQLTPVPRTRTVAPPVAEDDEPSLLQATPPDASDFERTLTPAAPPSEGASFTPMAALRRMWDGLVGR